MSSTVTSRSSRVIKKPKRDGDASDDDDKGQENASTSTSSRSRPSRSGAVASSKPSSSSIDSAVTDPKTKAPAKTASQLAAEKIKAHEQEDLRVWVECDKCGKWRALPASVDSSKLPDIWYCELNTYDTKYNSCSKEEEKAADTAEAEATEQAKAALNDTAGLRSFCGLWAKRLKCADKVVSYNPPGSTVTRTSAGSKRKKAVVRSGQDHQTDWIRCNNPMCGKWRAVAKGYDISGLLRRSVKRKWGGTALPAVGGISSSALQYATISSHSGTNVVGWCCWMNTWDETKASCTAPQEDIHACKWNLASSRISV
jgi:hypothetical protein